MSALFPRGTAVISPCTRYRYSLSRPTGGHGPTVTWVMINPSTGTAFDDDQTIRKVVEFSGRAGYGSIIIENLFAWRSLDVKDVRANLHQAQGPDNAMHIAESVAVSDAVVLAWGPKKWAYPQARKVLDWIGEHVFLCCGVAKDGAPMHPLMQPYAHGLQPFDVKTLVVAAPLIDSYGNVCPPNRPRMADCKCKVPCPSFRCRSTHHVGPTATPWCEGGTSRPRESCNVCWAFEIKRKADRRAS